MEVRFKLRKADGDFAPGRLVEIHTNEEKLFGRHHRTDADGRFSAEVRGTWLKALTAEGETLLADREMPSERSTWDLGDLRLPKQDDHATTRSASAKRVKDRHESAGVRGQFFYADGTMCSQGYGISVTCRSQRFSVRSNSDGSFFVPIPAELVGPKGFHVVNDIYVEGNEVGKYHRFIDYQGYFHVILPRSLGRGGSRGGMVSGQVVDADGGAIADAKVSAKVRSGGIAAMFLGGGDVWTTRSNRYGQFALRFEGGVVVEQLFVNGDEPGEILAGEHELPNRDIKAGSFGLTLRKRKGFLGSWF